MSRRKPFDLDDAMRQLERLGDGYNGDKATRSEIWKLKQQIYAEEDRQAQAYFEDPEYIARDKESKQKNKEAMDRWRAEHGDESPVVDPNKD